MMEIETLAEEMVDELTSAPSPTRAEAIEYVTGVLTALAIYHARPGPASRPLGKPELFWFDRGIMEAFRWLVADGNRLTAADMLVALMPPVEEKQ